MVSMPRVPGGNATAIPSLHQALFWPPDGGGERKAPTARLMSMEVGWELPPPTWLEDLCPEVVDHFREFPSFKNMTKNAATSSSEYAAQSICAMVVVQSIALTAGAHMYLHAGSHLGAVAHGQQIPWDDDVDALIPFEVQDAFLKECRRVVAIHATVTVHCSVGFNAVKVWLQPAGMKKNTYSKPWWSPFVDLFMYKKDATHLWEVPPKRSTNSFAKYDNNRNKQNKYNNETSYRLQDYFPTRPYYMGGAWFLGPPSSIAAQRYSLHTCVESTYIHRLERRSPGGGRVDCAQLAGRLPFMYDGDVISNQAHAKYLYPSRATDYDVPWNVPLATREVWFKAPTAQGQKLTQQVPNLNHVEVDNSIAPNNTCSVAGEGVLKVVEYNAERGRSWLAAVPMLKGADIIILNEMDIGMARSDQQHTTRLLAFRLGMNYAWGLEFVELTAGTQQEQKDFGMVHNFHGLHGNAFLTRCKISDIAIFRDPVGKYFDSGTNSVNANGFEKRVGGRMGIFGRIQVGGQTVVLGATHKLVGHGALVRAYIGSHNAITAGDDQQGICRRHGLANINKHNTYRATCTTPGRTRGDTICSNLKVAIPESVALPCYKRFGIDTALSDHAIVSVGMYI